MTINIEHVDVVDADKTDDDFLILGAEEAARQVEEAKVTTDEKAVVTTKDRKRPLDSSSVDSPAKKIKRIDLDEDDEVIML